MESYTLRKVSFCYPEQEKNVLEQVTLSVQAGEFLTICGPSGCGKTTLLRQLKPALAPHGTLTGDILFEGVPLSQVDARTQSAKIGFVLQDPDNQIVTDKVWHELAFGLESLGLDNASIRRRVAEMVGFFGMEGWFYKDVSQLSGGQKQLLNLAAIMAMQPSVLILDEPTSQLDPIAAADFLATVGRINRELGTTVILTEHRLEEVFPLSSRVLVMDKGQVLLEGTPRQVGQKLKEQKHSMFAAMPAPMRIYAAVESPLECPVTVREGKDWLEQQAEHKPLQPLPPEVIPPKKEGIPALEARELWFRYEPDSPDVVKGLSLTVHPGEMFAILGGNGAGKSTTLSLIAGVHRPQRGSVRLFGENKGKNTPGVGFLPQNPRALFVKNTVGEDLAEYLRELPLERREAERRLTRVIRLCHLETLLDRHPYDLSGGEQQRAALAKVLLAQPGLLLLDEPTKGLDASFKEELAVILQQLLAEDTAILLVSHDLAFCASYAHRCGLFFDGSLAAQGTPREFFSGNHFYTTASNRMARNLEPLAVTPEDVIALCGGTLPPKPELPPSDVQKDEENSISLQSLLPETGAKKSLTRLPLWKKIGAALSALGALGTMLSALKGWSLPFGLGDNELARDGLMVAFFALLALLLGGRAKKPAGEMPKREKQALSRRTRWAAAMILLAIPLTIFVGWYWLGDRKYYFISLLVILESMLPFFLLFEGRKPQARELILIASLCALGVAGRIAFYMLPNFKPVAALVIIAGVSLGAESGFLVGSLTMLLSNLYFQQGPWTPWQMFAMGVIGFLAGVLFRKGLLRRDKLSLCIFGALSVLLIYGGIMNPASMLQYQSQPTWAMLITYYIKGVPVDLVHAVATALFLWLLGEPMLEKLDRVKTKYGML